jgi:hypothetical protein
MWDAFKEIMWGYHLNVFCEEMTAEALPLAPYGLRNVLPPEQNFMIGSHSLEPSSLLASEIRRFSTVPNNK